MVDRKVAGLKNKVNGAFFEDIINQACDFYRVRGVADIEKTPEPVRLIKPIKGKPGYFVAVHNEAAQVDYKGFLRGGQAVEFEAKFTDTGRMKFERVTPNQQARLRRAQEFGAISFVICCFGGVQFYRIPWMDWQEMKTVFGRKFVTPQDLKAYEIRFRAPGALMFLDGYYDE